MRDLISALGTAQGRGGVAIIRVSGEGALDLAKKMFSKKTEFIPNMMYPGTIDCGAFSDYGMCVYFKSPKSFTGEDCVEFHCHGGVSIAQGVLRRTLELGARLAGRGEFTKRAFLNNKLSLSAAEGMVDMINAESDAQVRAGYLLYGEKLTAEGKRLQSILTECLAGIDADIDYPEEDLTTDTRYAVKEKLDVVLTSIGELLAQYRTGRKIKSGVNVVICGQPNAGKSSLLNRLLGYEKAIVSSIAGTTRDVVEGTLELEGVIFRLTDTAGIRKGADELEEAGIRRAEQALKSADVILYLKEDGDGIILPEGVPTITVRSRKDLRANDDCDVNISSVTGEGVEEVKNLLYKLGFGEGNDGAFLMEERHYEALRSAHERIQKASVAIELGEPAEIYSIDIKHAWGELGTLSGETANETIINEIFSKFCVGK